MEINGLGTKSVFFGRRSGGREIAECLDYLSKVAAAAGDMDVPTSRSFYLGSRGAQCIIMVPLAYLGV